MNQVHTAFTAEVNSAVAARSLAGQIRHKLQGQPPDALVVFASALHGNYSDLLSTLADELGTEVIVGASSAGEFTDSSRGEGRVTAMAIRSDDMRFCVAVGEGISRDPVAAAGRIAGQMRGADGSTVGHRQALVMADALAGHTDEFVAELTLATGGGYRFFGGGAGDDGLFRRTHVFAARRAYTDAAVALEIISRRPLGIGVAHGWVPASKPLRVTESSGFVLAGLDGAPAADAFRAHAAATGQVFDSADPLPFFLHNVLGIETPEGHRVRVPLKVREDGAVECAAAIPEGALVHIMRSDAGSAAMAARKAASAAMAALGQQPAAGAFVFDCVATRLRLGAEFDDELTACKQVLSPAQFIGCNTYGQIARADGQFGGFHNCTAVVCALPQ